MSHAGPSQGEAEAHPEGSKGVGVAAAGLLHLLGPALGTPRHPPQPAPAIADQLIRERACADAASEPR